MEYPDTKSHQATSSLRLAASCVILVSILYVEHVPPRLIRHLPMIVKQLLDGLDEVIAPIVIPRDRNVKAGVQYPTGGTGTIILEGTIDDVTYVAIGLNPAGGGAVVTSAAAAGAWNANVSEFSKVRLRMSVAGSGIFALSLSSGA